MENRTLLEASYKMVQSMDKVVDENLPIEIADIVKSHSKGAAIAAVASGWVPGIGGTAAVVIGTGFIWTMYGRINSKIDVPLSENIIKSVASGMATNLAAYAIGGIAFATTFSLFPGLGNVAAAAVIGGTCYALTLASGIVYLKILTRIFRAGKDPSSMTAEELKIAAKEVIEDEDIKAVMKEAKDAYKSAKARGEFQEEEESEGISK